MAAGAAIVSLIISAVSLAISLSMKQPSIEMEDMGVVVDKRGNDFPLLVPFGTTRMPLNQVYSNVNDTNTRKLSQLFCAGIGPVKSIQQVYINGVPYFPIEKDQSTGWYAQGLSPEFPNVSLGIRCGLANEAPMYQPIIDNSDGKVTPDFKGDRLVTASLLVDRWINNKGDNDIRFMITRNKLEILVQGNAVIDPRLDPELKGIDDISKRIWGSSYYNPACVILTYLTDKYFGMGFDPETIDIASFILLCNYCEYQNLQFNGYISQEGTRGEIIKQFAETFDGDIYLEEGKIKVRALDKTPATLHLDESNMLSEVKILNKGAQDYCNVVKIEYLNKDANYSNDQYVIPKNSKTDPIIAKDGFIKEKTIKMPYLFDSSNGDYEQVKFFANRAMKTGQLVKKSISFKVNNVDTKMRLGDVVEISNKMFRMERKKFRVTTIKSSMDDKILISDVEGTEYIEEVYDRGAYQGGGTSGSLPNPTLIINPPSNLVFTQNQGVAQGNGLLSWDINYSGENRSDIQYRKNGSSSWVQYQTILGNSVDVLNLEAGSDYDFRCRTIASIGTSRWTELLKVRIARVANLPAVKGLTQNFTSADAVFTWQPLSGAIDNLNNPVQGFTDYSQLLSYYRVEISHNTVSNVVSSFVITEPSFTYTIDQNRKDGLSRTVYCRVIPVSIYGDPGASNQISSYNEPMGAPSAVEARSELVNLTIQWLSPEVPDYDTTDIYVTELKSTPPTAENYLSSSNLGWWTQTLGGTAPKKGWVWIANRDVFGHPASGPVLSAPIWYEDNGIDDLLTQSPSFQEVEQNLEQAKQELAEQGGEIVQLQDKVALQDTAITNNKTLIETANTKLAQTDSTVQAQGVKITEQTQALSTVDGKVNSQKTIKLDVNGKVSGLQLGNDGTTSTFDVLTDVFRVSNGVSSQSVFEIRDGKVMMRNALIGNLTASNITAGSITGNEISALSLIRVGSGQTSASLDGTGSFAIYAGSTNGAAAPFRVDKWGNFVATNASITGNITATSGTFTGAINAQSGSISGALWLANNAYISGNPAHHFLNGANGRFIVDQNGNLTCQYAVINGGTFHGTVKVEQLVGDVYRKDFYSQRVIPGRIISGGAGEQEFFRANIGAQAFSQRLVLSNVNAPVSMYDNPGTADFYYQIEGQSPIWYNKIDGPSNTRLPDLVNFTVHMPAGATWIRFFCVPNNKITWQRQSAIGGNIEVMKSEQIGISVVTN
ncbi:phage tail protein [Aeromonas hydrophila]|uniref:phage tail tip fiber protein n=1 Tax=Aeromonas hydrophila TaxID=644 RepID=UPI003305B48C